MKEPVKPKKAPPARFAQKQTEENKVEKIKKAVTLDDMPIGGKSQKAIVNLDDQAIGGGSEQ